MKHCTATIFVHVLVENSIAAIVSTQCAADFQTIQMKYSPMFHKSFFNCSPFQRDRVLRAFRNSTFDTEAAHREVFQAFFYIGDINRALFISKSMITSNTMRKWNCRGCLAACGSGRVPTVATSARWKTSTGKVSKRKIIVRVSR